MAKKKLSRFEDFEDEVTVSCRVILSEKGIKVIALKYDGHKWKEIEITDFVPDSEIYRLEALARASEKGYFYKKGKEIGLW